MKKKTVTKKKTAGRPKKYTDEILKKYADEIIPFMEDSKNLWLKDFAILNNFPSENLSVWAESSEIFSKALKRAKDIQESKLVRLGLSKTSNPAFIIFTLKNVAGWRDGDKEAGNIIQSAEYIQVKNYIANQTKEDI